MKLTLYAEDVENAAVSKAVWAKGLDSLQRILPTRCPRENETNPAEPHGCATCERRGWLYPDPPDWWGRGTPEDYEGSGRRWEAHCWDTWRAMGILEESD